MREKERDVRCFMLFQNFRYSYYYICIKTTHDKNKSYFLPPFDEFIAIIDPRINSIYCGRSPAATICGWMTGHRMPSGVNNEEILVEIYLIYCTPPIFYDFHE
jgi:hypothetical protein